MAVLALSAAEAAQQIGISEWLVRKEIKAGRLPHLRIGRRVVIPRHAVQQWITDRAAASTNGTAS